MSLSYDVLEFVHVMAMIIRVGGVVALTLLVSRAAREGDEASLRLLARRSDLFGRRVQRPAVGVGLLAGLAMMGVSKISVSTVRVMVAKPTWG